MSGGQKKIFFPNLNGLRFLCFLSVFLFHSFYTENDSIKSSEVYSFIKKDLWGNGNIGVNFFFVLSGFLITYLLLEEKKLRQKIDLPKFWLRRILRIWPLYFLCVFFGFFIFPQIKLWFGLHPNENATILSYLTFTSNFELIQNGLPDSSILGVLWSIAIEEQFYLIWPVILIVIPEKHYLKVFFLILTSSCIFRYFNPSQLIGEYHTLSCMETLTIGAIGAYLCKYPGVISFFEKLTKSQIFLIYICFFTCYFFRKQLFFNNPLFIIERSIIAVFILLIIMEQNFSKRSFFKLSNFKMISELGSISYGLYCFHFIGILVAVTLTKQFHINNHMVVVLLLEPAFALLVTVLISKISFRFFETPFLQLKEKFAYITK